MTALLLAALLLAPIQPVALSWTIPPEPEPPFPGAPGWVPWRLDTVEATFVAGVDPVALSALRLYYPIPGWGFQAWEPAAVETFAPWEQRTETRSIPYDRPCSPCLLCLDYLCADGRSEQRCAFVSRPAEPAPGWPGFWQLGDGPACLGLPDLFADGFELGLARWER